MIFPEGRRTWDGRTFPIRRGIGALIKELDARVVFCHIQTCHLLLPRWAKWPRWVPLEIRYLPAVSFPKSMAAEAITQAVQDGIAIEPAPMPVGRLLSFRPAQGLETALWACPDCFKLGGLVAIAPKYRHVRCTSCGTEFEVSATNHLQDVSGERPVLHLAEARERLIERFGSPPIADQDQFARHGIIVCGEPVRVGVVGSGAKPSWLGQGRLTLYSDRLELVRGEEIVWMEKLMDCSSVAMEMGNILQLRTTQGLIQLDPLGASTAMWFAFIDPWRKQARDTAGEGS